MFVLSDSDVRSFENFLDRQEPQLEDVPKADWKKMNK